jgi:hypothetical protein
MDANITLYWYIVGSLLWCFPDSPTFSLIHVPGNYLHPACRISLRLHISSSATRGEPLSPLTCSVGGYDVHDIYSPVVFFLPSLLYYLKVYCCYRQRIHLLFDVWNWIAKQCRCDPCESRNLEYPTKREIVWSLYDGTKM